MLTRVKLTLALSILASFACTGYAIKCFVCDSMYNPNCGEKFKADDSLLFDCARIAPPRFLQIFHSASKASGCMKKVIEVVTGNPTIARSCYFGDIVHTYIGCQGDPSLPFSKELSCDVCTKDECNGSSSLAPIAVTILLFFGLARILA
ncbi:UPAR/Ly6 domain-containing protein bero-like [Drosophila tropicalis]|uniref:UPAR/Ly6 domain-containing protein bero-like n=1 Tax=Drosophila tropicalis TaxID=46794 RepID=UPI0035AC0717